MSEPFLSEIRIMSFNFPPKGWALCNGQFMPINQNQALFSLLGITYGGDGNVNFALPDLRGRVPIHFGNGHHLGERAGAEASTLSMSEMPTHSHVLQGTSEEANVPSPVGNRLAMEKAGITNPYSTVGSNAAMHQSSLSSVGGSQPHSNLQPFLVLNFCIALQGIFPSRN